MEQPTWALWVGILGIVFGGLGVLGASQSLMLPWIVDLQQELMDSMETMIAREAADTPAAGASGEPCEGSGIDREDLAQFRDVRTQFQRFWAFPAWYEHWLFAAGVLGLALSGLYILGAVFILLVRRWGLLLFLGAATGSAVLNVAEISVGLASASFMGMASAPISVLGLVVDLALIAVVLASDRSAFYRARWAEGSG